jgi:hypothetical protein
VAPTQAFLALASSTPIGTPPITRKTISSPFVWALWGGGRGPARGGSGGRVSSVVDLGTSTPRQRRNPSCAALRVCAAAGRRLRPSAASSSRLGPAILRNSVGGPAALGTYDRATVPEYLAPGVYVEEVSYRSKSIPGVSTSTTGFLLLGMLIGVGVALLVDRRRRGCPPTTGA